VCSALVPSLLLEVVKIVSFTIFRKLYKEYFYYLSFKKISVVFTASLPYPTVFFACF